MMIKILDFGLKLIGLHSSRQKEKIQRVIEYIDTCLEHMENVMGYKKDTNEVSVEQSRKFLQVSYHEISLHLNGVATPIECDIIKNSIASARIYYHAVKEGKVIDNELETDYESRNYLYRNNVYDQKTYRESSYEAFLSKLVKGKCEIDTKHAQMELQKIKEVCREDVARISSLKEKLKTRKVVA